MNFFTKKMGWTNLDFIPFKLSVASICIIAGSYFSSFFQHYYPLLFILFGIATLRVLYLWWGKMKQVS